MRDGEGKAKQGRTGSDRHTVSEQPIYKYQATRPDPIPNNRISQPVLPPFLHPISEKEKTYILIMRIHHDRNPPRLYPFPILGMRLIRRKLEFADIERKVDRMRCHLP